MKVRDDIVRLVHLHLRFFIYEVRHLALPAPGTELGRDRRIRYVPEIKRESQFLSRFQHLRAVLAPDLYIEYEHIM